MPHRRQPPACAPPRSPLPAPPHGPALLVDPRPLLPPLPTLHSSTGLLPFGVFPQPGPRRGVRQRQGPLPARGGPASAAQQPRATAPCRAASPRPRPWRPPRAWRGKEQQARCGAARPGPSGRPGAGERRRRRRQEHVWPRGKPQERWWVLGLYLGRVLPRCSVPRTSPRPCGPRGVSSGPGAPLGCGSGGAREAGREEGGPTEVSYQKWGWMELSITAQFLISCTPAGDKWHLIWKAFGCSLISISIVFHYPW